MEEKVHNIINNKKKEKEKNYEQQMKMSISNKRRDEQ